MKTQDLFKDVELLNGYVLLEPPGEEKTDGGIFILESNPAAANGLQHKFRKLKVVAAATSYHIGEKRCEGYLKPGDMVLVNEMILSDASYQGRNFKMVNYVHLVGLVKAG